MTIIKFIIEYFDNLLMLFNIIADIKITSNKTWDIFFIYDIPFC
jgi:hypothetical protein